MTSVATVRVSKLRRYGVPAYRGGCSPASLAVALTVGVLGFVAAAVALIVAENVASRAADYGTAQFGTRVVFANMPGLLAMAAGLGLIALGLALTLIAAFVLSNVDGVGCNGGGCCRLRFDTDELPESHDELAADVEASAPRYTDAHDEPLLPASEPIVAVLEAAQKPMKVPAFTHVKPTFMTTLN
jgi:hypothetical protein